METDTVPLKKLDECRWEIPMGSRPGMRVPGLIFSNERMIQDLLKDKSLEQVANVATLPGIVKASMAMPDIHWGYGFPVGGVAATDPEQGGVISPGGVGYDINCLSGDTRVLHRLGYSRSISEIVSGRVDDAVSSYRLDGRLREVGRVIGWLEQPPSTPVLEVITTSGRRIVATTNHPFLTPGGMKFLGALSVDDRVAVDPFEGVPYEAPSTEILIDEKDVRHFFQDRGMEGGKKIDQVIQALESRGLLPLRRNSPVLPYLIKALGFVMGDGSLYFQADRKKGIACFFGKPEDLEDIRRDLAPWWSVSQVYSRHRKYKILTEYGLSEFEGTGHFCRISASSFAVLLALLGCPVGNKASQDYGVPVWLRRAPLWQKRSFLAAYFGAELQSPRAYRDRNQNFPMPLLTVQKRTGNAGGGRRFLLELADMAKEFGVKIGGLEERSEGVFRKGGTSVRLRLMFSSQPDSLLALYGRIGFEYNRKKRAIAAVVLSYIGSKKVTVKARQALISQIVDLRAMTGFGAKKIAVMLGPREELQGEEINRRFIERTIYGGQKRLTRTGDGFIPFDVFRRDATQGIGGSGLVWEAIQKITTRTDIKRVYDITVNHPDHNFVANGFVVHNCGVRLVRTHLTEEQVRPVLQKLVAQLFRDIPTGVGREGQIRFTDKQERQILEKGSGWIVKQGYGTPQDLEHTEAGGCLEGANADNVSERAYERGRGQVGTLGSGNHFLEVQAVDQVYDEQAAQALGVREGQVLVMIHSGSRGLGYQVCDDYLEGTLRAAAKYGIHLVDRQLACAPVNSPEGQAYLGAMRAAANYAWANRQLLMHRTREVFERIFGKSWQGLGMSLIYDVAHNIAKMERYKVEGKERLLCVHRKGATRAFPKGHPELSEEYRHIGQPVIIPGDMGRNSYLLVGSAAEGSFGSTCHGAGRVMSRTAAVRAAKGRSIRRELEEKGIIAMARGRSGLDEEQPEAYKDVNEVVDVVHQAGLSRRVCRMKPMGVIKG